MLNFNTSIRPMICFILTIPYPLFYGFRDRRTHIISIHILPPLWVPKTFYMLFRGLRENALSKNHFCCNLFYVQLCTDWTIRPSPASQEGPNYSTSNMFDHSLSLHYHLTVSLNSFICVTIDQHLRDCFILFHTSSFLIGAGLSGFHSNICIYKNWFLYTSGS